MAFTISLDGNKPQIMRLFSFVFILLSTVFIFIACQSNSMNMQQHLSDFYTDYIIELSKDNPDINKLQSLRKNILSPALFKKYQDASLDYDPIINAQDVSSTMLETLEIKPLEKENFQVCYADTYATSGKNCFIIQASNDNNKLHIQKLGEF